MEMDPFHLENDGISIGESSFEPFIHPVCPEISGISGEPQVNARVGGEYQAEIPPMISEYERSQLLRNPLDSEGIVDGSHSFLIGLPSPITWVHNETNNGGDKGCRMNNPEISFNANGMRKSRTSIKNNVLKKKSSIQNAELLAPGLSDGQESKPDCHGKEEMRPNLSLLHKKRDSDLVPGSFGHPWNDAEVNSFILGLYIFGKSFFQIRRFIDNKEMGDILSFYYGEFYASDGYRRWSDCHKKKRKKCIYGEKLFTGWRQEELLSRLHPHVPEHSQSVFLEVSTAFSEGKSSLEDYVSNLKAIVGIQALVDAIGIGKGKEDLTSLAIEPGSKKALLTVCPIGKACASLTASEIIKLLTGGFRLSKARCNDIFWEAIWPRLLARGWHSEQPKSQFYLGSNHCLVFLTPGVKKFSKRKLVKGEHYFDSVSDVLSKVASEPKLIELETEEARGSSRNEEERWAADVASDQDDPSIQHSHRYLKPRCSLNLVRFTIIDSGLVDGGKLSKLIEMRYSPDDLKFKPIITTLSSNIKMIFLENSLNHNELGVADNSMDGSKKIKKVECDEKTSKGYGSKDMKFTIVDTSLIDVGKSSKVRELRYSPAGIGVHFGMNNSSDKNEGRPSQNSKNGNGPMAADKLLNGGKKAYKCNHSKSMLDSSGSEKKSVSRDIRNKLEESLKDNNNVSSGNQSRTIKHKFSRRPKSDSLNNLVPTVKRRRLTACTNAEASHVIENFSAVLESKQEGSFCALKSTKEGKNTHQIGTPEKLSTTASVEGCPEEAAGCTFIREASRGEKVKQLNDLKLPQTPFLSENDGQEQTDAKISQGINVKHTCFPSNSDRPDSKALSASVNASDAAQLPDMNPRRHSTRNRPLTTKALEALECGFLESAKRQKGIEIHTQELPISSFSRRPHNKVKLK